VEIAGVEHSARKIESRGISRAGEAVHFRAARVSEAEHFGHLVEGLARGIVARPAEEFVFSEFPHIEKERVPAADDESDVRGDFRLAKKRGEQMAFDVVDCEKWAAGTEREPFGGR
jgi:hypothetical protein